MMGDGLQDGCVLEGVQGQHGGRGNPMGEDKIRKRGLKRGYGEGGGMSPDDVKSFARRHDQSDQSVSVSTEEEITSPISPINTLKWGEGRGQDQGGRVQGGEALQGGGGGTSLTEEKVSSKIVSKLKVEMRERGGRDLDVQVQVGGAIPGGEGGLTPNIIQEEEVEVDQSDQSDRRSE